MPVTTASAFSSRTNRVPRNSMNCGASAAWSRVKPAVPPGRDDRDSKKTGRLLRNAPDHARLPSRFRERAISERRPVGIRAGLDLAGRYRGSHHERLPQYSVRISRPEPVRGPVCPCVGRYNGMACSRPRNGLASLTYDIRVSTTSPSRTSRHRPYRRAARSLGADAPGGAWIAAVAS